MSSLFLASAAVTVEQPVEVATQLKGQISYFQYQLPTEGMTLHLTVVMGKAILYASTEIANPNSALHDVRLETDSSADVFLSPKDLFEDDFDINVIIDRKRDVKGSRKFTDIDVFVSIEGLDSNNSYVLDTTFGDTSTRECHLLGGVRE